MTFTGTSCSLQTQSGTVANYICDSDNDCFTTYDLGKVIKTDSVIASQEGDSGAPVFSLDGNGVRAKGVVSAGDGTTMVFATMDTITVGRGGNSPWPFGIVPRTG